MKECVISGYWSKYSLFSVQGLCHQKLVSSSMKKTGLRLGNGKQHVQSFVKADIVPRIFCLKNLILLRLLCLQCRNYDTQEETTHLNTHPGQMKLKKIASKH